MVSELDKVCECCDEKFSSYVETICDDCQDEHDKGIQDSIDKLKAENEKLKKVVDAAKDVYMYQVLIMTRMDSNMDNPIGKLGSLLEQLTGEGDESTKDNM